LASPGAARRAADVESTATVVLEAADQAVAGEEGVDRARTATDADVHGLVGAVMRAGRCVSFRRAGLAAGLASLTARALRRDRFGSLR
jgi:hypothetical protein